MKLRYRLAAGYLLLLAMVFASPFAPAASAAVTWNPQVDLTMRGERPPGEFTTAGDWIASFAPQLTVAQPDAITWWEILGRRRYDSYARVSGPTPATDLASLKFSTSPDENSRLRLDARYLSTRDPIALDPEVSLAYSESAIASGIARLDLWRVEGRYNIRARSHESAGLSDGLAQSWEAVAFPYHSPDTRGVVGWRGRDLAIDGARAMTTSAVTVGFRRRHFESLWSEFEVGAAETVDRGRGTRSSDLAWIAGANAERGTLRLPVDLRFRVARDVATTGFVEASLPARRGGLSARWERALDAEGGIFSEPTLTHITTLDARDTLAGQYVVRLWGSIGRTQAFDAGGSWLKTYRTSASLSRGVLPWLSASLDYSFLKQDAAPDARSSAFRRGRIGLTLTMGPS